MQSCYQIAGLVSVMRPADHRHCAALPIIRQASLLLLLLKLRVRDLNNPLTISITLWGVVVLHNLHYRHES